MGLGEMGWGSCGLDAYELRQGAVGGGRFYCEMFYGYLHEFQTTHDIFQTLFCVTKKNLDSQCPGQYLN